MFQCVCSTVQKVLPSEGPRPLGLAAEDLLALRVVPRPRRLDQLLVASHRPAQQHKIKSHFLAQDAQHITTKTAPLCSFCHSSHCQTLPCSFPGQKRDRLLSTLVAALHARARAVLPPFGRWGWRAQSRFTYINNHATPTTTVFRGRRKPLIR